MRGVNRVGWTAVLALAGVIWGIHGSPAAACNTPVYRYAMYNWPASPYYLFYFHRGEIPETDAATHALIERLASDEKAPANLLLEKVDVSEEKALERMPGAVEKAYQAHQQGGKPFYVIFTPYGTEFYAGPLGEKSVAALIDSPARQKVGDLLHEGNLTVLVLLPGEDEKLNAKAEKEAEKLVEQLAGGEIDLGPDPSEMIDPYAGGFASGPVGEQAGESDEEDKSENEDAESKLKRTIALVKLSRDDAAEKCFVDALMQVEPDLKELADEPMVFGVYGRGRAMPPFVGEGITAENMTDLLFFLSGACSCQIKDQNPGMDLPMARNWDAAAEAIAATDPAYADPYGYDEYPAAEPEDSEASEESASSAGSEEE